MKINDYIIPDLNITQVFSDLQLFQYYDKYSRFLWDKGRREDWHETIARTVDFLRYLSNDGLPFEEFQTIFNLLYLGEISPSMRLLNMAGPAAERDNSCLYNCSYLVTDTLDSFHEMLTLSMSGCGVGFSVESQHVNKLPVVNNLIKSDSLMTFIVNDDQEGWQNSIRFLFKSMFEGYEINFNYSKLREAGSPLYTKGGYSSGPEVLKQVHEKCAAILRNARCRKLTTLECFDLMTILPEAGISGGVRRAATCALFDYDDDLMNNSKRDDFWQNHPNRVNANISAVWPNTVSLSEVKELTHNLFTNGTGENGIFKRDVALSSCNTRRWINENSVGSNPCFEINLQPNQFCNLSSIICKPYDTLDSLIYKTKYATLVGDIQSLATHFPYLRSEWKNVTEKERLLGVNHINHAGCKEIRKGSTQRILRDYAVQVDLEFADTFNVCPSAAITSVKPSGNSSVLYGCGPGLNPEHNKFSCRNVTVSKNTAMFNFLKDYGIPHQEYPTKEDTHVMFSFPTKAEDQSIISDDIDSLQQLEYWKLVKENLVHHNPSTTITYSPNEIDDIQKWLYDNQHIVGGIALFPKFDNSYSLCPVQKINQQDYISMNNQMPKIDWEIFHDYEQKDEQSMVAECSGGRCDL